jgi:flagellar FliL protein
MADPTPAAPGPDTEAAPKKSKKMLFIIIGAVVLLGGGGAAAYFLMKPTEAEKKAAAAEAAKHVEPIYVALDPPFVVNFESGGLVRFLQVSAQVMTQDAPTAELLKRHDPVIRNGLLMLFSGQSYATISTKAGKEQLRKAALAEVRRVVATQEGKAENIKDLYFTSFVMQ